MRYSSLGDPNLQFRNFVQNYIVKFSVKLAWLRFCRLVPLESPICICWKRNISFHWNNTHCLLFCTVFLHPDINQSLLPNSTCISKLFVFKTDSVYWYSTRTEVGFTFAHSVDDYARTSQLEIGVPLATFNPVGNRKTRLMGENVREHTIIWRFTITVVSSMNSLWHGCLFIITHSLSPGFVSTKPRFGDSDFSWRQKRRQKAHRLKEQCLAF